MSEHLSYLVGRTIKAAFFDRDDDFVLALDNGTGVVVRGNRLGEVTVDALSERNIKAIVEDQKRELESGLDEVRAKADDIQKRLEAMGLPPNCS